jgi:hypothetical protein
MRRIGLAVILALLISYQVLPAEANPSHDRLIALSDIERNKIFTALLIDERCVVTRSFFQGFDKNGSAYWNVACTSRTPLSIQIMNNANGSTRVLECSMLRLIARSECFKKFSEQGR